MNPGIERIFRRIKHELVKRSGPTEVGPRDTVGDQLRSGGGLKPAGDRPTLAGQLKKARIGFKQNDTPPTRPL